MKIYNFQGDLIDVSAKKEAMCAAAASATSYEAAAPAAACNGDDLFPREDISPLMTDALMAQLIDPIWKERKAAMEIVEGILTQSGMLTTLILMSR